MKTEIIPVVVGAIGVIKKGSENLVREIPGNINLWKILKKTLWPAYQPLGSSGRKTEQPRERETREGRGSACPEGLQTRIL